MMRRRSSNAEQPWSLALNSSEIVQSASESVRIAQDSYARQEARGSAAAKDVSAMGYLVSRLNLVRFRCIFLSCVRIGYLDSCLRQSNGVPFVCCLRCHVTSVLTQWHA